MYEDRKGGNKTCQCWAKFCLIDDWNFSRYLYVYIVIKTKPLKIYDIFIKWVNSYFVLTEVGKHFHKFGQFLQFFVINNFNQIIIRFIFSYFLLSTLFSITEVLNLINTDFINRYSFKRFFSQASSAKEFFTVRPVCFLGEINYQIHLQNLDLTRKTHLPYYSHFLWFGFQFPYYVHFVKFQSLALLSVKAMHIFFV